MSQRNTCVPDQVSGAQVYTVLDVHNRASGEWSIGVLMEAARGAVRFTVQSGCQSADGHADRLRNLERDGLSRVRVRTFEVMW